MQDDDNRLEITRTRCKSIVHWLYLYLLHYKSVILFFPWQLEVCLKDMEIWQNVLQG